MAHPFLMKYVETELIRSLLDLLGFRYSSTQATKFILSSCFFPQTSLKAIKVNNPICL